MTDEHGSHPGPPPALEFRPTDPGRVPTIRDRASWMGVAVANLGDVLTTLGQVAVAVDRAGAAVNEAGTACGSAGAALAEVVAGSNDWEAGQTTQHLTVAASAITETEQLLYAIASGVTTIVERMLAPDGSPVPAGARAARAPVAGRGHPTHTPAPPPDQRDHDWATQVGAQLTEWEEGNPTEALVFDAAGQDWQVNSGVDAGLTTAARTVIENMIADGEVGASTDFAANIGERTALRDAASHAETKAAVWAAAEGKQLVDVVTNRKYVCGQYYEPGNRRALPGCAQAVAAILPAGFRMRVWRRGVAAPMVITGRGRKADDGR
jgi:hypothetical protein